MIYIHGLLSVHNTSWRSIKRRFVAWDHTARAARAYIQVCEFPSDQLPSFHSHMQMQMHMQMHTSIVQPSLHPSSEIFPTIISRSSFMTPISPSQNPSNPPHPSSTISNTASAISGPVPAIFAKPALSYSLARHISSSLHFSSKVIGGNKQTNKTYTNILPKPFLNTALQHLSIPLHPNPTK